jgi:lipopolysaccharide export system protein LptC
MSSPIEQRPAIAGYRIRRAVLKARLAPFLGWIAAGLGLAFVAAFVIQAGLFSYMVPGVPDEAQPGPRAGDSGALVSYDSTLSGFDKDHQPYEVKAKRGWQDTNNPDLVHMETVTAKFRKASGEIYDMTAGQAHYDSRTKQVDLENGVVITQHDRLTARMTKAHADINAKSLVTDVPVDVDLGDGTIKANGMQITDDGAKILFLNGVKAHFNGTAGDGGTNP